MMMTLIMIILHDVDQDNNSNFITFEIAVLGKSLYYFRYYGKLLLKFFLSQLIRTTFFTRFDRRDRKDDIELQDRAQGDLLPSSPGDQGTAPQPPVLGSDMCDVFRGN